MPVCKATVIVDAEDNMSQHERRAHPKIRNVGRQETAERKWGDGTTKGLVSDFIFQCLTPVGVTMQCRERLLLLSLLLLLVTGIPPSLH